MFKSLPRSFPATVLAAAMLAAMLPAAPSAFAQSWPAKPVRIIVAFPAGGGVDFVARVVAQRLTEDLKQTFVVENRAGANGAIGADALAKSAPDGYTMLVASPGEVVVGPAAGQKLPYDVGRDLVPVTLIGETPLVIAAYPGFPGNTIADVIALSRKEPSKLAYGTPGTGSSMHFAGESLNAIAKIDLPHVPYKGAAPAINDLLGGQVLLGIVGMPPTVAHAKAGKLRILAVTSDKRSSTMPDVPTVAEMPGFNGYRFTNWMGVFVPAKTPPEIVQKLSQEIARIVREPAVRDKLSGQGVEPSGNSPAEFGAFMKAETERYSAIAKLRGIHVE